LIGHAAKHHYSLRGQNQMGIPQMMLARLRRLWLDSQRPNERLAYFDPASNPGSTV